MPDQYEKIKRFKRIKLGEKKTKQFGYDQIPKSEYNRHNWKVEAIIEAVQAEVKEDEYSDANQY